MQIAPFQFEDLMGDVSPVWYRFTNLDEKRLAYFKEIFTKNHQVSPRIHPKIPPVLHWIWLGPKPFPALSKKKILSWQALHPGWEMKFWTDSPQKKPPVPGMKICPISDLPDSPISHLVSKAGNYGEQSDLIRYIILWAEGGIYVDHDVSAILPFDVLNRQYDFYAYLETPFDLPLNISEHNIRVNNGLVGVKPGHPVIEQVMKNILEVWDEIQSQYPNNDPDTQVIRTLKRTFFMFTEAAVKAIDQPGYCDIIFPASFGCPRFGFRDSEIKKRLKERSLIYAEHSHDSLWCSHPHGKEKRFSRTFYLASHVILTVFLCFLIVGRKRRFFKAFTTCLCFFILPTYAASSFSDPDFLIIGCMKSGTSQLTYFLSQHPHIGCSSEEIHFFDSKFEKGRGFYQAILPKKKRGILVTGEDSPNYICDKKVPSRVFSMYPSIKLIVILRSPVDRTYSHYQMRVRLQKEPLSFEEALAIEERKECPVIKGRIPPNYPYLETSMYARHLERWFSFFSPRQMLVLFNEDLKNDPLHTLNRVCAFLEVPPFTKMPNEDPSLIRKYPPMNPATRQHLEEFFAPHDAELERLLGRPLPWSSS
jgi:hypothetical protein